VVWKPLECTPLRDPADPDHQSDEWSQAHTARLLISCASDQPNSVVDVE
jgi:hypothetical protein